MSRLGQSMIKALVGMMGRYEDAGPRGRRLRAWMMRNVPGQLTCVEFEEFVHDYQEGALSPPERRIFDLHMELCPMCRVYFATYRQTIELGRRIGATDDEAGPEDLPEELTVAILAARRAR